MKVEHDLRELRDLEALWGVPEGGHDESPSGAAAALAIVAFMAFVMGLAVAGVILL
ncbi:MAG: hypothetical protein ABR529_12740 [Actinomycetota bacterium]